MSRIASTRARRFALATVIGLAVGACTDESLPAGLASAAAPVLSLFDGGAESPVTTHAAGQFHPAVDGSLVVYADNRSVNYDVYLRDVSTGVETRIVADLDTQQRPGVSQDFVVWEDWRGTGVKIRALDLRTMTEFQPQVGGAGAESGPRISGHRVVYGTNRASNHDVYMFDFDQNREIAIANDPKASSYDADIGGDLVVWQEHWGGADDPDIVMRDLNTGVSTQITTSSAHQSNPATDGLRVVYQDNRHGNNEIYMYDPATGAETRITRNPATQRNPDISGNVIVWEDERNGNSDIYAYDLATGTEHRITTSSANQLQPSISGNRIVWHDNRSGNADVYMFTLAGS
jgi:beta propeller repeat protein